MFKRVWMVYDLGFEGNYAALYRWLDDIGAKECVMGGATFMFDFHNTHDREAAFKELEDALPVDLEDNPGSRIYAIISLDDNTVGRFLIGRRKTAPWYGSSHNEPEDEDG